MRNAWWSIRFDRTNGGLQIRHASVSLILIMLCFCITACSGAQAPASSTRPSQQSTRSSISTPSTVSAVTISPQSSTLGGDLSAFDKKYGPAYREDNTTALYQNATYQFTLFVVTDGQPGELVSIHDRIVSIDAYQLEGEPVWDLKTVQHICGAFMPTDSKFIKDVTGSAKGEVLHIYESQLLANTLPSRDFVISSRNIHLNGQSVEPGLFTVGYNNFVTGSSDQYIECGLGVGIDYLVVG